MTAKTNVIYRRADLCARLIIDQKHDWAKVASTCARMIGLTEREPDPVFDKIFAAKTKAALPQKAKR